MLKIFTGIFILKYWFLIAFTKETNQLLDEESHEKCFDCALCGNCPIIKQSELYRFNGNDDCYLKNRLATLRKDYEF